MTPKLPLLLLVAVTLCCCITTLHALQGRSCHCIRKTNVRIPLGAIERIEVIPVSGQCRRTEIIVTTKRGAKVCVNPSAKWVKDLLSNLERNSETINMTSVSPAEAPATR